MPFSKLYAVSSYLPEKVISNDELSKSLDTSHDWIVKRTGICNRHILKNDQNAISMAILACQKLFSDTQISPPKISSVIVACNTSGTIMPSIACHICNHFLIDKAFALDVNAACSGFLYALSLANDRILLHEDEYVLVVGVDAMSRIVNWKDRQTAVLFGDGAGCVLLKSNDSPGIISVECGSDSKGASLLKVTGDIHSEKDCFLTMQGKEVFKFAVDRLASSFNWFVKKYDIPKDSIDWLVPHQANERILDSVSKRIGFDHQKIIKSLIHHANTSAASIPLALQYGIDENKIKPGNRLIFQAFGAGFTWGIAAIDF